MRNQNLTSALAMVLFLNNLIEISAYPERWRERPCDTSATGNRRSTNERNVVSGANSAGVRPKDETQGLEHVMILQPLPVSTGRGFLFDGIGFGWWGSLLEDGRLRD
jgi:hypothetical protein